MAAGATASMSPNNCSASASTASGSTAPAAAMISRSGAIFLGQPLQAIVAGQRRDARLAPSTDRPSGCAANAASNRWSWIRSSGASRHSPSSGQHDRFLALQLGLVELRRAHQVGDQLDRQRDIGGQDARMKRRLVARGPGVECPADILDRLGDGARVAAAGALEHHMLDQMGEAALALGLGARPDRGVEPDRGRSRARHRVDRDRQAIGQAGQAALIWLLPRAAACAARARRSPRAISANRNHCTA